MKDETLFSTYLLRLEKASIFLASSLPFRFVRHHNDIGRCQESRTLESPTTREVDPDQTPRIAMRLEQLPIEVLQHIASFLLPDSVACLTLCSQSLRHTIGQ